MDEEKNYLRRLEHVENKVDDIDKKVDEVIITTDKEREKSDYMFGFFQTMIDTLNNTQSQIAQDMKDIKDIMIEFVELSTSNSKDIENLRDMHEREIKNLKDEDKKVNKRFENLEDRSQEALKEKWKFFSVVVGAIVTIITGIFSLF